MTNKDSTYSQEHMQPSLLTITFTNTTVRQAKISFIQYLYTLSRMFGLSETVT